MWHGRSHQILDTDGHGDPKSDAVVDGGGDAVAMMKMIVGDDCFEVRKPSIQSNATASSTAS